MRMVNRRACQPAARRAERGGQARAAWLVGAARALLLLPIVVGARELPYGAVSAPRVQHCDALNWSARHALAADCYRQLADSAPTAAEQAEGAWALGQLARANELFRAALAARPADSGLRVRWGELYLDSHQPQQALDLFKEALRRDPQQAYAQVDSAAVLADDYAAQAGSALEAVMQASGAPPGARLRALLLATRIALEDSDVPRARALLDQAEALATRAQLPLLEIEALRAALAPMQGAEGSMWSARALAQDPAFGEAYALPAHILDIHWRLAQAIELYRRAVGVQPELWSAQRELAECLLRADRLDEAREHLQAAYHGDPYDPVTVNLLRLLDSLRQFEVLPYDPGADGKPTLIVRISRQEAPVLAPYVRRLAEQAIRTYTVRYRFTLRAPVVIEVYPNHDDLAVRTAGLPGLGGELGVTFGYLVALDSPGARAVGASDWGSTLWHEMAHVFTLESSDFHVPRWLTEGLSVFEEWRSGPIRGEEIPDYVFAALAHGQALPIAQLDRGFVRPDTPARLIVSYMQAALVCEYVQHRFGDARLLALLQAFEATSDVSTALQRSLGMTAAQFDARFAADLSAHYGTLFAHIDQWLAARRTAADAAGRADWPATVAAARAALALMPQDVDADSPYLPLARAYEASGAPARALSTLIDYRQRGGHDPQALELLAQRLQAAGRLPDAIAALDAVNYVAPFDAALHGQLGDWLLQAGQPARALAEYGIAAALHPVDEANAHLRLARAQFALQALPEAQREVLAALEVAPDFRPAQQLLLQIARASGRLPGATPRAGAAAGAADARGQGGSGGNGSGGKEGSL